MDAKEAWRQYDLAEKRLERCRLACQPDPTGTRMAEYAVQAAFRRWLVAAGLVGTESAASEVPERIRRTATAAWIAS